MASLKLLRFTGRCRVSQATSAAERAAHQAAYLGQWRALAPKPARRALTERQRLWLARILGIVVLLILGAALWPDGQTHPLSYSQPEAAQAAGSQDFDL